MDYKNIIILARESIQIQIDSLNTLTNSIDNDFVRIVRLIYETKGRLIVTGIGKSAIVGQKIVATFNSTGTAAIFMHAADAIHGDLGMLQEHDIVLCISKSGETSEIKILIPFIKKLNRPIIGITANSHSFLAQHADHILLTPVKKEADPNNLAPTTSTTLQMVMGDALAISLLNLRGFSKADFAKYHPGGSLGKQLYLKVSDVISVNLIPSVSPEAHINDIILEISGKLLGATAVVENSTILGIITDGDLRRMLENRQDVSNFRATDIMTKNPISVNFNEFAINALQIMKSKNINQLIVENNGNYIGMVHIHNLLKEGII